MKTAILPPSPLSEILNAALKSDREVEVARTASVAARTHKDTKYCVGLWESWREWIQSENKDSIEPIEKLSKDKIYNYGCHDLC